MARDHDPLSRRAPVRDRARPAARLPGLCAGLCLHPFPRPPRRGPDAPARGDGLGAARLLVSADPLAAGRGAHADLRALSLRLSPCPRGLPAAKRHGLPRRARARAKRLGRVLAGQPADGPAGHRGGCAPGHHGDHRRLRDGGLFRRPDLRYRDLHELVLARRPRGGGAAGALPSGLRAASGRARTHAARRGAAPRGGAALRTDPARAPDRLEGGRRDASLHPARHRSASPCPSCCFSRWGSGRGRT
jgi:hypothetical protein